MAQPRGRSPGALTNLSDRERAELQAAGKCFGCRQPGHLSRNCPEANRVKSARKGRPPGVTSFSVEPAFGDLSALAASTARIDELELHCIALGDFGRPLGYLEREPDGDEMSDCPSLCSVSDSSASELAQLDEDEELVARNEAFAVRYLPCTSRDGRPYVRLEIGRAHV